MSDKAKLARVRDRLSNTTSIALPTCYPRPTHEKQVEAAKSKSLSSRVATSLARLSFFEEEGETVNEDDLLASQPKPFHLLLSAFTILLHRYTGDTDLLVASSSATSGDPLLLRIKLDPTDSFWSIVRRVQFSEQEAERDVISYPELVTLLDRDKGSGPLFRVRFFDKSDRTEASFYERTSTTSDMTIFISTASSTADELSSRSSLVPQVSVRIHYNALLFSEARINYLLEQLEFIISTATANPLTPVGSISLLTPSQQSILPNPKADLEFCGWRGAITDIFQANAAKHPDRTCIVESLSSGLTRKFSYQQMNEASNILAHHLIANGVEREGVVTVYSTRGVDLVVAVMGILKAGATFSVIDPAYPPARQQIYLQVAKPRALVILERAGKLLPQVRNYVTAELDIKCEVPALRLLDDGTVLGSPESSSVDNDVFTSVYDRRSQPTGVALGPDSVGTLSFTSGSTGIPKGVRGRHFSLTHFFPWMAKTFGMDEKEKFTMLSGIAHDPIQRDIFTPLFLGAQLHIPTAEDIGTPGRLAEWMAASEVTVTHLTPAMGQLLSAQATKTIHSLHNAFFVGDILTKRDCSRLQQLAPNTTIINMYGTTETQRAVSYFAIPPLSRDPTFLGTRKDIMPAGAGMINVQLLVVNRNDRNAICGVGEIGEIYVRSGGLAEGYLELPEATAEKFIPNWFTAGSVNFEDSIANSGQPHAPYWKGVRDRLYRSGDLGRYGPDGMVECTGRADDQIKIRGFRIELGEIDTHLSRHPLVRENVTLVRRDKDEEKVLVAYFVPLPGKDVDDLMSEEDGHQSGEDAEVIRGVRRYKRLIKDIREYLKTKLPSYSIPSLFVPLTKMPLNPNGKIDKPALPFPDTALAAANAAGSGKALKMSPTEASISEIWSRLLPSVPQPIPLDESFFDLGGHSILATRLVFEIRKSQAVNAPLGLVFEQPTIKGLAKEIDILRGADFGLAASTSTPPSNAAPASQQAPVPAAVDYAEDADKLITKLAPSYPAPQNSSEPKTILLTGATGFLGAFILKDLLERSTQVKQVICHVRAQTAEKGLERLRTSGVSRDAWREEWVTSGRLKVVLGDLEGPMLGLSEADWQLAEKEVDVIVHNGALVHWIYPYQKLRAANVLATMAVIDLAATPSKPKAITFVSSTAALETPRHYIELSDEIVSKGGKGVPESDDLEGSRTGITSGYGQTKWTSERVLMEAGRRGLRGGIVRPSYVVGDSQSASTNTDDFVWRLVKGCIQLGLVPDIHNAINMTPVDHVAKITAEAALASDTKMPVYHVTGRPNIRFNDFLDSLAMYGYRVQRTGYLDWRTKLEQHVLNVGDNALFPLLHFVLDDLPTSTKAPELDDSNTVGLLARAGEKRINVTQDLLGLYLAWLIAADFLPHPTEKGQRVLPKLQNEGKVVAMGRSGH